MDSSVIRAAMILDLFGDEVADEVLARLPADQAAELRSRQQSEGRTRTFAHQREMALEEFERYLRLVLDQRESGLGIFTGEESDSVRKGSRRPQGREDDDSLEEGTTNALEGVTAYQLAGALQGEQARIAALLLATVRPERTAEVLGLLDEPQRHAIVRELSREPSANPSVIEQLTQTVVQRAQSLPARGAERVDRIERLADVLRAMDKPQRKKVFRAVEEHDKETAEKITQKLYRLEDLLSADDRVIQKVLANIDGTTLATSLVGADDAIVERILKNLSRRARQSLEEELEFQAQSPPSHVEHARGEVVQALARIDQENE